VTTEVADVRETKIFNSSMAARPAWSRRGFAASCLGAAGLLALPSIGRAAVPPLDRRFAIFRDGDEIGRHEVRFEPTTDGFDVTTDIDIVVKLAFITAFHFRQHAVDRWVAGNLVESRVTTDDNGTRSATEIEARGSALSVEGGTENRTLRVPLGTMTDIAFWNLAIVRQRELVDIQKATLTDVAARHLGSESIDLAGQRIVADRFTIHSNTGRNGDIWFDAAGNWVQGHLITRGEALDYRLIA
jgi:hypothetical protein